MLPRSGVSLPEKAVSRFRPTGKMLGLGLIISVTVSALVCLALLPAERTELAAKDENSDLDAILGTEGLALRLAEGRSSASSSGRQNRENKAKGALVQHRKRLTEVQEAEKRALHLAEGRVSQGDRRAIAQGLMSQVMPRHAVAERRRAGKGVSELRALRLAEGNISEDERKATAEGRAVAAVERSRRAPESRAERLAEAGLSRDEHHAIADGYITGGLSYKASLRKHVADASVGILGGNEAMAVRLADGAVGEMKPASEAERLAEGQLSEKERQAIAQGSDIKHIVAGGRDVVEPEAERLAEGKLSQDEKKAIAQGSVIQKVVSQKRGPEFEAEPLADGSLSREERRAVAYGSVSKSSARPPAALVKGVLQPPGRANGRGVEDQERVRSKSHVGSRRPSQALLLAEGKVVQHLPEPDTASLRLHRERAGVHESQALRIAEGKLDRDEKIALADGRAVDAVQERVRGSSRAQQLAEGYEFAAGGQSGSLGKRARSSAGRDDSEALRLAEGKYTPEEARSIASSGVTPMKGGVDLADLSKEERSERIQHLLDVAKKISERRFQARPQQLAETDDQMSEEEKGVPVSALKQRELNAFVDRVDAERSGSILQAGIEPKEWRSVVDKVMAPRTDRQLGVAVAMKGLDSIAGGAQASLSDVDVPLDQAVRRGWGGL